MEDTPPFLDEAQEQALISAIRKAEKNTSGEIRIHIEKHTDKEALTRGIAVFKALRMHRTKQRNGVLLYVATQSRKFAIVGDRGINKIVPDHFWDAETAMVLSHFKSGAYLKGLAQVVLDIGEKLKHFFPYQSDDINELSDEISKE